VTTVGQRVTVGGRVVTKRHGGRDGPVRAVRAAAAMRAAAAAGLPVPRVLAVDGRLLLAERSAGRPAVADLAAEPARVLSAIGRVAAALRAAVPPPDLEVVRPGGVWVHGDLCPVNLLLDGPHLAAVVDWEDSRVDDPLVDLVWTEWLVRTHHRGAVPRLPALYAAAGGTPPAERRRAAMARVLEHRRAREGAAASTSWDEHLATLPTMDLTATA
jgi:aminoglycoside phosphotransferase